MKDTLFISTEFVDADQKTELWREVNRPLFDAAPLEAVPGEVIEGAVNIRQVGELITAATSFNRQRLVRDRSVIIESGLDSVAVQLLTAGSLAGNFGGVNVTATAGDILLIDLGQSVHNQVTAGSRITFLAPRAQMEKQLGKRRLHGFVFRKDWPITGLLRSYLTGLHAVCLDMSEREAGGAMEATFSLLAAGLARGEVDETSESALGLVLQRRVLAFVDQNIRDLELSPEMIMRKFRVSRSHLYRAFASMGGVSRVLRERRLDAAFAELSRGDGGPVRIADVACRLGFSSGNQLLRAFRSRFGVTPSQVRAGKPLVGMHAEGADALRSYYEGVRERALRTAHDVTIGSEPEAPRSSAQ